MFFDGGCRPNPGPIEVAAVVRGVVYRRDSLGPGSNHDAEWLALLHALDLVRSLGLADAVLLGDSRPVVAAASLALRTGRAGSAHEARFLASWATAGARRVRWIKRQQNLAGIALAAGHPR